MTADTDYRELVRRAQAFVDRKYVARADARQKEMGLAYVEAERQDLAKEIARFTANALEALLADLHAVADFAEPHWRGAGLKLESGWILREMQDWSRIASEEGDRADAAEDRMSELEAALRGVLEANASFRATMPHDWDGDWLQDACNKARAALATESASAGDSDTRKDVMPSERKLSTDVPQPALPDLLPCPFCGKPAKLKLTTRGQWWVHCTAPYLCMGRGWSSLNEGFQLPQDATDAWNRRALASQTQEPNHER